MEYLLDTHALLWKITDNKPLSTKVEHLEVLENLEFHHRDPFDRILIAQCLVEKMAIMSKDKIFSSYSIKRIW